MTKILTVIMAISLGITVTACSSNEEVPLDQLEQVKKIGVLKSLGISINGEGTHILEMQDNTTIRLLSDKIDLDNSKYLNKNVEVRGVIQQGSDGKDMMNVQSIDLAEQLDEDEEEKGVETEYKTTELGISFMYLDSWEIDEKTDSIDITSSDDDQITISRLSNPEKKTLEAFLGLPDDPNEVITLGYTENQFGTGNVQGLKKESSDGSSITTYIPRDKYIYKLSFSNLEEENLADNKNIYFDLLNSFTLIPIDQPDSDMDDSTEPDLQNDIIIDEEDEPEIDESDKPTEEEKKEEEPSPEIKEEVQEEPLVNTDQNDSTPGNNVSIVSSYISSNINNLAPEASENGKWYVSKLEFAEDNYVYVEYNDGSDYRKILLSYNDSGSVDSEVIGYFEPGETTSWEKVSGENPAAYSEKTVVSVDNGEITEETVVKEGFRYFESLPYEFKAQYPSNWYYSGQSGGDDAMHHYGFSNEPIEDGNEIVSLDIVSGPAPSGSTISVGSNQGIKVVNGDTVAIYIEREDGNYYKVHGDISNQSYVVEIAASIE